MQQLTSGMPPPAKPTTDSKGNELPGTKLIKQMEAQGKPVPASVRICLTCCAELLQAF
jgi:hypothetical protein